MLSKSLLLLGLTALAASFTIPPGTTDGFYHAYYDVSGVEVHELIPDGSLPSATDLADRSSMFASAKIGKRATTWCGCSHGMDHGSTDQANSDLQNQLSGGPNVGGNSAYYSIRGSTVAFVCNKDSYSAQVFGGAAKTGAEHVTNACGWYIAGTWRMDGFSAMDFGYMDSGDNSFCQHAEGSGQHSCGAADKVAASS